MGNLLPTVPFPTSFSLLFACLFRGFCSCLLSVFRFFFTLLFLASYCLHYCGFGITHAVFASLFSLCPSACDFFIPSSLIYAFLPCHITPTYSHFLFFLLSSPLLSPRSLPLLYLFCLFSPPSSASQPRHSLFSLAVVLPSIACFLPFLTRPFVPYLTPIRSSLWHPFGLSALTSLALRLAFVILHTPPLGKFLLTFSGFSSPICLSLVFLFMLSDFSHFLLVG